MSSERRSQIIKEALKDIRQLSLNDIVKSIEEVEDLLIKSYNLLFFKGNKSSLKERRALHYLRVIIFYTSYIQLYFRNGSASVTESKEIAEEKLQHTIVARLYRRKQLQIPKELSIENRHLKALGYDSSHAWYMYKYISRLIHTYIYTISPKRCTELTSEIEKRYYSTYYKQLWYNRIIRSRQ